MSFKTYAQTVQPDGRWMLSDPRPLMFSGRPGLIARFVEQEKQRAAEAWKLEPGELHALALPGDLVRERVIVFEQQEGSVLELMWLQNVRGVSAETTEMLFSFTPLRVEQVQPMLLVREPNAACAYGEDLTLDGGVTNLSGSWRWRKPHLALGGVKVGPPAVASSPGPGPAALASSGETKAR
jgi:hypothetical protein